MPASAIDAQNRLVLSCVPQVKAIAVEMLEREISSRHRVTVEFCDLIMQDGVKRLCELVRELDPERRRLMTVTAAVRPFDYALTKKLRNEKFRAEFCTSGQTRDFSKRKGPP
jgi:hypothetical protein